MAESDSDSQVCLTTEYEVLRRIFDNLSYVDLVTCTKVCEEWHNVGINTMKKSNLIHTLLLDNCHKGPFVLSDAALTLVFNNANSEDGSHEIRMSNDIMNIFAHCGTIDVHKATVFPLYTPLENMTRKPCPEFVRFPPHHKVNIKQFTIDRNIVLTKKQMEERIGLSMDVQIKGFLIIGYGSSSDFFMKTVLNLVLLQKCIKERKPCAVAGCINEIEDDDPRKTALIITIFLGDNVEVGSCTLDACYNPLELITLEVEDFSKCVKHHKNSVLLNFRCRCRRRVERGHQYSPTENLISNAIGKYFPTVTSINCYGMKAIGLNYPKLEKDSLPRALCPLSHSACSTLLYIAYT